MKYKIFFIIPVFILFFSGYITAKPNVAFGYMHNITNDHEFNYLEFILPNSFANSINAVFNVNVKKPLQLEKELSEKGKSLKKDYESFELPDAINDIGSDIFIFGNFRPMGANQIKIVLNIYIKGYSEIFTFTNIGKMETQIARLVDRISIIIINFMSENNLYRVRKIMPGTRLAVLTNLDGEEQNRLLITFMENRYTVLCFQNNELHNIVDNSTIAKFSYIKTEKNSYDVIEDWRKAEFLHGTWTNRKYDKSNEYIKKIYNKYNLNYDQIKTDALERLDYEFGNRIDVLLIIGFSDNRKTSWVRAVDMKEKELIWMQSNIKSDKSMKDRVERMMITPSRSDAQDKERHPTNVTDNVNRIIEYMTAEPLDPFKVQDNPPAKK